MPFYTTSILTACISNTSLPIGFIFGRGETKKNYTTLLKTIESQFKITFKGQNFESDQGQAICGLCMNFGITHFACIRHLLAGMKWSFIHMK